MRWSEPARRLLIFADPLQLVETSDTLCHPMGTWPSMQTGVSSHELYALRVRCGSITDANEAGNDLEGAPVSPGPSNYGETSIELHCSD